ncbi:MULTISPECIES: hypothetical protein [unclassified Paenibacillus]|uniref:hypothetical protein n=1 Tax=unclassified Paenibacillus TaxID=185978 RepID=UPI0015E35B80|nr:MULTISPECIES: hypothetical protein [unclassified Paenibacillus]MBJ9992393.1 hypothetical protein [Paenibacillus sp. S28]
MKKKNKRKVKSIVLIRPNAGHDKPMRVNASINELEWLGKNKSTQLPSKPI